MKILCLLPLFFAACVSQAQSKDELASPLPKGAKPWVSERATDFRGDYRAEEFAGSLSLHLRAYFDDESKAIRYAACLIVTEDVAAKPTIETWFNLVVTKGGLATAQSKSPLFYPVILANGSRGILVRGVVLKPFGQQ